MCQCSIDICCDWFDCGSGLVKHGVVSSGEKQGTQEPGCWEIWTFGENFLLQNEKHEEMQGN